MLLYVGDASNLTLVEEDMCMPRILDYLRAHQPQEAMIRLRDRSETVALPKCAWSSDDHVTVRRTVRRVVNKLARDA